MKLGLISDSHDHVIHVRLAMQCFWEHGVTDVVHAGDFVHPHAILAMEGMRVHAVLGNNDHDEVGLQQAFARIGGRLAGNLLELSLPAGLAAVYHGTVASVRESLVHSGKYGVVVLGHTHKPLDQWVGTTRVFNPGTAHGFGRRATVMIYDTDTDQGKLVELKPDFP